MTPKDLLWATKIMELPTSEMEKFYMEDQILRIKSGGGGQYQIWCSYLVK